METVGVYGFVGKNWQENDYPVDLWVKHHEKIVDKISIVTHCDDIGFKYGPKVTVTHMDENPRTFGTYRFYIDPLNVAQRILDTDWKVLLPTDEFLAERINANELDKLYAYAAQVRNFYGNLSTELIAISSPAYQWRVHYGNREVFRDGGDVVPPYYARFSPLALARMGFEEMQRRLFLASRGSEKKKKPEGSGAQKTPVLYKLYAATRDASKSKFFTVWHTGMAKNPKAMVGKWREISSRDANAGSSINKGIVDVITNKVPFSYHTAYKRTYRGAELHRVRPAQVPKILLQNKKRFNWVTFSDNEYAD
jgi:hypothetical protein